MWNLFRFFGFVFGLILLITSGWLSWVRVQEPESPWILLINVIPYEDAQLVRVNTDGSGTKYLTSQDRLASVSDTQWSDDGKTVYFNGIQDINTWMIGQFYQIKPNGMGFQNISPFNLHAIYHAYHSSENDIFMSGQPEEQAEFAIYRFNEDTNQLDFVVDVDGKERVVRPSPDGKWLIFSVSQWYRVRPDGSQFKVLPDCLQNISIYAWSPDSRYLPCIYIREGITHLSLLNIETLEITLIKQFENFIYYINWSPDGEWLIFKESPFDKPNKLFKIRIDGSDLTQITNTDQVSETMPSWSPDGNWIGYFQTGREFKYSLYKIRPDGSDKQWLGDFDLVQEPPLWSPIIDYAWHDKHLFGVGGMLLLLSLLPIKKSLW